MQDSLLYPPLFFILVNITNFLLLWLLSSKVYKFEKSEYWRALIVIGTMVLIEMIFLGIWKIVDTGNQNYYALTEILMNVFGIVILLTEILLIKKVYSCTWTRSIETAIILKVFPRVWIMILLAILGTLRFNVFP